MVHDLFLLNIRLHGFYCVFLSCLANSADRGAAEKAYPQSIRFPRRAWLI